MSRRKQAKPQQVRAEQEEGGQRSPTGAGGGSDSRIGEPQEDPVVLDQACPSEASSVSSAAESGFEMTTDSLDVLDEGGREWDDVTDLESSPRDKYGTTSSPQPPGSAESSSSQASGGSGAPSTNVTLEILHSTRVAVAQFSQGLGGAGLGGKAASAAIPVILDHLLALQQQQVVQLQLIEQICSQVAVMNGQPDRDAVKPESRSLPSNPGTVPPPILPLLGTVPSAVSLSPALETSQSVPSQTFCGHLTSASSEKSSPSTSMSTLLPVTPHGSSQTPSGFLGSSCSLTFLPQSPPSSVVFPNPLASMAASTGALDPLTALMKQRRGKLPNTSPFEPPPTSEEPFFKHKCRFCAKVFGSDSALQIHLRSHTGERPFKCNICGNRFSTKGNLKVHFQRHRDKYPHVQMNPFPVPEYLDSVPTSSGIPYGMSVPPEKPVSSWLDSKPVPASLTANVCVPLSSAGPDEPVSLTASVKSHQAAAECVSVSLNPRASQVHFSPISDSNRKTEASKGLKTEGVLLPQTPRAHPASETSSRTPTPDPISASSGSPALVDSMQTSETSKLQQLVENIDRKVSEPNRCSLCHRVLSCQSALKMHYRVHSGERPFRCKVCGRAFATKGNLKTHVGVHQEGAPVQARHSCPVCQRTFSDAVVLQQHVRLHVAGRIPDGLQGGFKELTDDTSMEEEGDEEEGDAPKPLISESRSPSEPLSLSVAAPEDRMRSLNHRFTVKALTNGLKDGLLLGADGISSDASTVKLPAGSNQQETHKVPSASVKRERPESPESAADPREDEPNKHRVKEVPHGLSVQLSRDTVAGQNSPGSAEAEAPFSPAALPGPPPPRRAPRQHNCSACGKNFSSASALQIHERTHTGEKPFVCSVCGRAFTTKGNLKVHMGTHMWNNAPARRGRRLSVENPSALTFGEAFHKDLATRAASVDPGFWSRYASAITNSLALKNEISVIQNPGLTRLHPLTAASAAGGTIPSLNKTAVDLGTNRHFSTQIDDSKEIGIN